MKLPVQSETEAMRIFTRFLS